MKPKAQGLSAGGNSSPSPEDWEPKWGWHPGVAKVIVLGKTSRRGK